MEKKKILIGIPCLYGENHCREAIESVVHQEEVYLLLIDNGAEEAVSNLLQMYREKQNVMVIHNKENVFVNPAWNQILKVFLTFPEYDNLIIMNSDLIMQQDWAEVVRKRWAEKPDEILIPDLYWNGRKETPDGFRMPSIVQDAIEVHEGTPGVFITLNRKQAESIFPIPKEIKVWFGDNWIYEILRNTGYKTVIPPNLVACHHTSSTISRVPGISEIIEEDKIQWETVVNPLKNKVIEKINGAKNKNS